MIFHEAGKKTEKAGKPQIRFVGFDDEWEQYQLVDEVYSVDTGRSKFTPNKSGDYEILGSTSVIGYDDSYDYEGDFLLTARVGANVGELYRYSGKVKITDNTVFIQGKQLDFIYYVLLNFDIKKLSFGTGQPLVRASELKEQKIFMSISDSEREKIGKYFKNLDRFITFYQSKYDKLIDMKKAMLEKMFPKDGEAVPEIRFKGFSDAWEQRKFSELYEKVSRKNDLTYGKDDIISVANMYFKEDSYITDESYLLTYNIFELGDIAFEGNKSKNYAHGRFVENTIGNGIVSHVFDVFKPIMKPYDLQFWKYAINNEQLMGGILLRSTKASTMMTNLVANDFLQETFLTPTYPEQQKIGAFFQQLDHLITFHQNKLEKLKNLKKAFLKKMFI